MFTENDGNAKKQRIGTTFKTKDGKQLSDLLAQGLLGIPEFNLRDSGVSPRGSEAPGLNFQSVRGKEESVKS